MPSKQLYTSERVIDIGQDANAETLEASLTE